jgi:hypothetical protein
MHPLAAWKGHCTEVKVDLPWAHIRYHELKIRNEDQIMKKEGAIANN